MYKDIYRWRDYRPPDSRRPYSAVVPVGTGESPGVPERELEGAENGRARVDCSYQASI